MSTSINIDVDLDDVLWGMSSSDKQELADELYEAGYIPTELAKREINQNDAFSLACHKLIGEAWRLSREEVEFIINISKRF